MGTKGEGVEKSTSLASIEIHTKKQPCRVRTCALTSEDVGDLEPQAARFRDGSTAG